MKDGVTMIPIKSIPVLFGSHVNWTTSGNVLKASVTPSLD